MGAVPTNPSSLCGQAAPGEPNRSAPHPVRDTDAPPTGHSSWRLPDTRIVSGGVDLVDLERLSLAVRRGGEPFVSRVLTRDERDLVDVAEATDTDGTAFGALFAAKESVIKVVRGLPAGAGFHDIVLPHLPRAGAAPVAVRLRGPLQRWARDRRIRMWSGCRPISPQVSLAWALATPDDVDPPGTGVAATGARS